MVINRALSFDAAGVKQTPFFFVDISGRNMQIQRYSITVYIPKKKCLRLDGELRLIRVNRQTERPHRCYS